MLKKMCVIRACWIFQKSKMMGYIPVQRRTVWAMIVQVPALVSLFISFVPAFCARFFVSFKIDTIFPSYWLMNLKWNKTSSFYWLKICQYPDNLREWPITASLRGLPITICHVEKALHTHMLSAAVWSKILHYQQDGGGWCCLMSNSNNNVTTTDCHKVAW